MPSPRRVRASASGAAPFEASGEPIGDRYRRLHRAQRSFGDTTLATMLERIVGAACDIAGVRSAALAIRGPEDSVEYVVTHGDAARLGPARVATDVDELLRALDTDVPDALRAVLTVSGVPYADLVLCAPRAGAFSDDDLEIVDAIARAAADALEHATLAQQARSSVKWLHASGEIARALLADADIDAFSEVVARAVDAAGADYGHLVIPTHDGRLRILGAHGIAAEDYLGKVYPADLSDVGRAVVNGKALRGPAIADMHAGTFANPHRFGPVMIAPLLDALGTRGSVLVTRTMDREPFTDVDLDQFSTYAAQVALAMQFADARTDAERLQVVEARVAASRGLSDIIMQRLFAVGVGLDTISNRLGDATQSARLQRHIQDLDETIEEIRGRVFDEQELPAEESKFPRVLLPADLLQRARGAERGGGPRRGRRRTDWRDGSGTQR
jgi:hypothetical protein